MKKNDIDKRQGRLKYRGRKGWLVWLCNPRVLELLIRFGMALVYILKALYELAELVKLLKS